MLNRIQDNFDAKEGLDFLEFCWEKLSKMPKREMLVGKLVNKVELEKDVKRLRKWWEKISQGRRRDGETAKLNRANTQPFMSANQSALPDHKWASKVFKKIEARAKSKSDCEPMLHETIKQVFK